MRKHGRRQQVDIEVRVKDRVVLEAPVLELPQEHVAAADVVRVVRHEPGRDDALRVLRRNVEHAPRGRDDAHAWAVGNVEPLRVHVEPAVPPHLALVSSDGDALARPPPPLIRGKLRIGFWQSRGVHSNDLDGAKHRSEGRLESTR